MTPFGYHLTIDVKGCNDNILDKPAIKEFLNDLLKRIDMKPVGEPLIEYIGEGPELAGYSVVQLIVTSSITMHLVDLDRRAYIDIFSCKRFEAGTALCCIVDHFEPTTLIDCLIRERYR